jgi:hypothetical protein
MVPSPVGSCQDRGRSRDEERGATLLANNPSGGGLFLSAPQGHPDIGLGSVDTGADPIPKSFVRYRSQGGECLRWPCGWRGHSRVRDLQVFSESQLGVLAPDLRRCLGGRFSHQEWLRKSPATWARRPRCLPLRRDAAVRQPPVERSDYVATQSTRALCPPGKRGKKPIPDGTYCEDHDRNPAGNFYRSATLNRLLSSVRSSASRSRDWDFAKGFFTRVEERARAQGDVTLGRYGAVLRIQGALVGEGTDLIRSKPRVQNPS